MTQLSFVLSVVFSYLIGLNLLNYVVAGFLVFLEDLRRDYLFEGFHRQLVDLDDVDWVLLSE